MRIPKHRGMAYAMFRACERFGIIPPNCKASWAEMHSWQHALLIGYDQIRQIEEVEMMQYGFNVQASQL